jgi:diguanylate cyclase (GGDEF)-like protein
VPAAIRDDLTGLPTLAHLAGMFDRLRRRAQRSHRSFAFITFSIDEFRLVCEAFGREQADDAIKSIASLLRTELDANAIIVRAAKSTFVVVLNGLANATEATGSVHRILQAIARPRDVGGQDLRLTASAGIATFPTDGGDYETLLRNANAAMRASRAICHGGQRCHVGNDAVSAKRRLQLRTALGHAIEHRQLTLHYQPQFEVRGGRASGVEVLARWFPVDGDAIAPGAFIPLAERTGLIGALGAWVLQEACETAAGWHSCGESAPTIGVNVSTYQIDENLCGVIRQALERAGISPDRLELEITEGSLMRNPETALECLREWKELGVRIAIDDFGTGYSNLSYLSRLPVDRLKIDKSLIYSLTSTRKGAALVRSIIALGKDLGIGVIAEGVETWEQFRMLQDLGCLHVQGYLLAPPAPAEDIQALLGSQWGMRAVAIPGDC